MPIDFPDSLMLKCDPPASCWNVKCVPPPF
jgi:hypothetical protein